MAVNLGYNIDIELSQVDREFLQRFSIDNQDMEEVNNNIANDLNSKTLNIVEDKGNNNIMIFLILLFALGIFMS